MGLFGGVWLVVVGVLGAANLIIARKPDAKQLISKLAPYQGWIGAGSALWGVWIIIHSVLSLSWIAHAPILWATMLSVGVVQAVLGLLLGVGVLKTFIKQPTAVEKMDATITKLAPKQGLFGLVAIGLGTWMVVAGFIWRVAA